MIRDDLEGKTDNHCFDWETGDEAATEAVFAKADVVVNAGHRLPAGAPGADGDLRRVADYDRIDGKLTLWSTTQAPHAHRTALRDRRRACPSTRSGSSRRTSAAASATRCRSTPATSARSSRSIVTGKPVKWMEDRSENLISTGFARDYIMRGEIAATKDGKILAIRTNVLADHGAFNGTAAPVEVPGRLLRRLHRQLRHRGRLLPR